MQWRRVDDRDMLLFVCDSSSEDKWYPYTQSKNYVPDYLVPGVSKGFATYQNCLKLGYKILNSENLSPY
jgi:hypothetical protein